MSQPIPDPIDVVIVCALEVESQGVQTIWEEYAQASFTKIQYGTLSYYQTTMTALDGTPRTLLLALMPRKGEYDVLYYVPSLIKAFQPRVVLMTGICAGD